MKGSEGDQRYGTILVMVMLFFRGIFCRGSGSLARVTPAFLCGLIKLSCRVHFVMLTPQWKG